MYKTGDTLEGEILSLSFGGESVFKKNGLVLFAERGVPGDHVILKIKKLKKNYGSAEIIKIIKPSQSRINSNCASFDSGCGGCQWLNILYREQLFWKTKIIRDSLKHIGKLSLEVLPIIAMIKPEQYRNKLSTHNNKSNKIGLMKKNSHEIITFDVCRQESEANVKAYKIFNKLKIPGQTTQVHIRSNSRNETGICIYGKEKNKNFFSFANILMKEIKNLKGVGLAVGKNYQNLSGNDSIIEEICNIKYNIHLNGFFQTNYFQASKLLELVLKLLNPGKNENIIDLYCGCGFFSLPIARQSGHVYGIENSLQSISNAKFNAKANNIKNIDFTCMDAKKSLLNFRPKSIDSIVLDPPRTGCEREVLSEITRIKPSKIIYVSCSPDTLARDLNILKTNGYALGQCRPIDMFPQTFHVEMVTDLYLK